MDCILDKTSFLALDIGSPVAVANGFVEPQACSTGTQDAASTPSAPKIRLYGVDIEANE